MSKYYYIFCATLLAILSGCSSGNQNTVTLGKDKLLIITGYAHNPEVKLEIFKDGNYVWKKFDVEKKIWIVTLAGSLVKEKIESITADLEKESSEFRLFDDKCKIINDCGENQTLRFFRVLKADNNNFFFDYLTIDSTTMFPTVIEDIFQKCQYDKTYDISTK